MTGRIQVLAKWTGVARAIWLLLVLTGTLVAQTVEFRQTSVPVGIINQTTSILQYSYQTTLIAPEVSGGYTRAYWTLNGVRSEDPSGAAANPVSFIANTAIDAVAIYFPSDEDTDHDGLLDWWEWRNWGNLNQTSASDPDGDGFSNAEEYARGQFPRLNNLLGHGGISRRRGPSFIVIQNSDTYAKLVETSDPAGVINQERVVTKGLPVTLTNPPDSISGWRFTGWLLNGSRWDQPSAWQPLTITPSGDLRLVARYILETQDSDGDGLLDWKEMKWFESLQYDNGSDPDADGFTIAQEEVRGFSSLVKDDLLHGGLSRRRGNTFFADVTGRLMFRQVSSPTSILDLTDYQPLGTLVAALDRNNHSLANYKFSWWDLNGTRREDASGVALTGFSFTLNTASTATAHYVDPGIDADADGILDWNEWTYYGTLNYSLTSDTDADGFTYAEELTRGQSPRVVDTLAHGGISRRRGSTFYVDTTGRLMFRLTSSPATILEQTNYLSAGTIVTVPDKNNSTFGNYKFSWWDRNGVRQTDASGVALTGMSFPLTTGTVMQANYIDPSVDTDGDGILDWNEWTYYGSLGYGPTSDTDADGFTYSEELARNQSPRVADVMALGGISRRRGALITLDPVITPTAPEVGYLMARNVGTTTATISALVNPMSAATTANFEYGPAASFGNRIASESILNGFIADSMSAQLSNLLPNTTYYYRVIATNIQGETVSLTATFRTLSGLTPYQQWKQIYSITSDDGDNDADGVKNLVEYAFGGNPQIAQDAWKVPTIDFVEGKIRLSVTQPSGVNGILYRAEWSDNLSTWLPINDTGSGFYHEFLTPESKIGAPKLFVRWVISVQ